MNSWENTLWRLRAQRGPLFRFRESTQGLIGDSRPWLGPVIALPGLALLIYAFRQVSFATNWAPWVLGGSFFLIGIISALSRNSLVLNHVERRWSYRWRFLIWVKQKQGTFDDFKGIALTRLQAPALTHPSESWVVSLEFRDSPEFFDLFWSYNERKARAKLLHLAAWLGLAAIDETQ